MRILMLCEGDPETRDSWSGISKSVLHHLRAQGQSVITGDAELYGVSRWLGLVRTFSPQLERWRVKYRLAESAFNARSHAARSHVRIARGHVDLMLQVGATFDAASEAAVPYVLYCDSNIRMAEHGAQSGQTHAVYLTATELEGVRAREGAVYHGAARVFTVSNRLRRSFIEDFNLPPGRVVTIYAGPNLDPAELATGDSRGRHGTQSPTAVFVGRDFVRKGGDLLLAAFTRLRTRLPDARLLIVGPASRKPVPGISWLGFLNPDNPAHRRRLHEAFQDAMVFCLPTRFEPFGVAFIEAMHRGLACIGPRAWAVPEIVEHGVTGLTVPGDDVDALENALYTLLSDPDLARRMGDAACARAHKHFAWPVVVRRMLEHMEAVARNGARAV